MCVHIRQPAIYLICRLCRILTGPDAFAQRDMYFVHDQPVCQSKYLTQGSSGLEKRRRIDRPPVHAEEQLSRTNKMRRNAYKHPKHPNILGPTCQGRPRVRSKRYVGTVVCILSKVELLCLRNCPVVPCWACLRKKGAPAPAEFPPRRLGLRCSSATAALQSCILSGSDICGLLHKASAQPPRTFFLNTDALKLWEFWDLPKATVPPRENRPRVCLPQQ